MLGARGPPHELVEAWHEDLVRGRIYHPLTDVVYCCREGDPRNSKYARISNSS